MAFSLFFYPLKIPLKKSMIFRKKSRMRPMKRRNALVCGCSFGVRIFQIRDGRGLAALLEGDGGLYAELLLRF